MAEDADDPFARARTHQALLSDGVRTLAYRRALEAAVRPDDVVLDLGCGTGIFSMIAARRGCRKVYAVDRSAIIEDARETARRNGLDGRIEFIRAPFDRLELPERVDLIVHELIGSRFWDEEILASVARARAAPPPAGGRLLPFRLDVLAGPDTTRLGAGARAGLLDEEARGLRPRRLRPPCLRADRAGGAVADQHRAARHGVPARSSQGDLPGRPAEDGAAPRTRSRRRFRLRRGQRLGGPVRVPARSSRSAPVVHDRARSGRARTGASSSCPPSSPP